MTDVMLSIYMHHLIPSIKTNLKKKELKKSELYYYPLFTNEGIKT